MSQAVCPQGVLRERLSDTVNCARVVRVQRHRRYQSHLIFTDDLELTLVNTCNFDVSTICIDRKYVFEYSGGPTYFKKFAMRIEAHGPDGRKLNILRRDEKCLLDKEPGLDYLCVRLNEPIKPGNYYVLTLTHTAQTLSGNTSRGSRLGKLMDFLTPYFDVYVFSFIHPINQPPTPWTQSQYHHYEVVPEHLEIHSSTTRIVQWLSAPHGMLSFIASDGSKNLAFGFTVSEAQYTPQQPQQVNKNSEETSSTNVVTNIVTTLITSFVSLVSLLSSVSLFFAIIGMPILIRLTLNRLYKAFSWMLQSLSIATIALSLWAIFTLLLGHTTHLLSDLFAILTTLLLLLLSNYIVIPKQAPIKYERLQILTYAVIASIISLITIAIIKAITTTL